MSGPNSDTNLPAPVAPRRRSRPWLLGLGVAALLGLGGYALAMGGPGGWHGPWGHGPWDPARKLERMQAFSKRALDGVGASAEQEAKIHDIIASAFAAVNKDRKPPEEMRKRLTELMKAPTVDRAAVESLRAEMVASLDARSKIVAGAVLDASSQLSADQRGQLADRFAAMMEHHRGFGGWRRPRGERRDEDGPRPDGAPGDRPGAN